MNNKRLFTFPDSYTAPLESALNDLGFSLGKPQALAKQVKRVSDLYADRQALTTLWLPKGHQAAYLAYYLPLNYLRLLAVMAEGQRLGFFSKVNQVIDFGSGVGTAQLAGLDSNIDVKPWVALDSAQAPIKLHQQLIEALKLPCPEFNPENLVVSEGTLGLFSYSLNELDQPPRWIEECSHLLILEPSTETMGRQLMLFRQKLIDTGWHAWAPCTHQQACPLLTHSKKDWCHDRIFADLPSWFRKIENHLPMKNRTVTFSYLLASKTPPPVKPNITRVIGDTLKEKGKTRQAICRGPEREFLAWLKRDGDAPSIPRGSQIEIPSDAEKKGSEIRGI